MNYLWRWVYARRFRTGYKPDAKDGRDAIYTSRFPGSEIPSFDFSRFCFPYSQGRQDCVSNSCLGRVKAQNLSRGVQIEEPSRAAMYYAATAETALRLRDERWEGLDAGTFLRDWHKGAKHYGIVTEKVWPYSRGMKKPPWNVMAGARHNRLVNRYERVRQGDVEAFLDVAQRKQFPAFGTAITADWYTYKPGQTLKPPTNSHQIVGYHAVFSCGYDASQRRVRICNSWGTGWGENGFGWLDLDYLRSEETRDVWA